VRYLVLAALKAQGIDIKDADKIEDGRLLRT
jgi:hypothetical protein